MARRATTLVAEPDPIDDAIRENEERQAGDVTDVLDFLSGLAGSDVKIMVYQVLKNGKWAWIKDLSGPFDTEEEFEWLRVNYGAGDFVFRAMSGKRIAGTKHFTIAGPKALANVVTTSDGFGGQKDLISILMASQSQARQDQMANTQLMMQMMQSSNQMMMGVMTAIIGKPVESDSAKLLATVEALKAITPQQEKSSFKEMLENMTMLKQLAGDGGGGDEDTSLMGMAKQFLPALGSMASEAMKNAGGNNGTTMQVLPPIPPQVGQVVLAGGGGGGPHYVPPGAEGSTTSAAQGAIANAQNPIIAAIREDVLYLMRKPHSPEISCDTIIETLDAANIGEDAFNALAMEFLAAGENWPLKVKEYGIDITGREQWFSQVVTLLAEHYGLAPPSDNHGGDDTERAGRSASNPGSDVSIGQLRHAEPAGQE